MKAEAFDIKKISPLQFLIKNALSDFSGTLGATHTDQSGKVLLFVKNGVLSGSKSTYSGMSLLDIALERDFIKVSDLNAIKEDLQNKTQIQQIQFLISKNIINLYQIEQLYRVQLEMRMALLLNMSEGSLLKIPQNIKDVKETSPYAISFLDTLVAAIKLDTEELKEIQKIEYMDKVLVESVLEKFSDFKTLKSFEDRVLDSEPLKSLSFKLLYMFQSLEWIKVLYKTTGDSQESLVFSEKELQNFYKKLKVSNFYDRLSISKSANLQEIKTSYLSLAKVYHPDRIQKASNLKVREVMEKVFQLISEAQSVLSSPSSRKEYDENLNTSTDHVDIANAENILESELIYQEALALSRKGLFGDAREKLKIAVALYDDEADYHALLGWSTFREGLQKKNKSFQIEGKKSILKAIDMYAFPQAYYYLGMICKQEGNIHEAKKAFQNCLKLDEKHAEANSEMRFINMRKDKK